MPIPGQETPLALEILLYYKSFSGINEKDERTYCKDHETLVLGGAPKGFTVCITRNTSSTENSLPSIKVPYGLYIDLFLTRVDPSHTV